MLVGGTVGSASATANAITSWGTLESSNAGEASSGETQIGSSQTHTSRTLAADSLSVIAESGVQAVPFSAGHGDEGSMSVPGSTAAALLRAPEAGRESILGAAPLRAAEGGSESTGSALLRAPEVGRESLGAAPVRAAQSGSENTGLVEGIALRLRLEAQEAAGRAAGAAAEQLPRAAAAGRAGLAGTLREADRWLVQLEKELQLVQVSPAWCVVVERTLVFGLDDMQPRLLNCCSPRLSHGCQCILPLLQAEEQQQQQLHMRQNQQQQQKDSNSSSSTISAAGEAVERQVLRSIAGVRDALGMLRASVEHEASVLELDAGRALLPSSRGRSSEGSVEGSASMGAGLDGADVAAPEAAPGRWSLAPYEPPRIKIKAALKDALAEAAKRSRYGRGEKIFGVQFNGNKSMSRSDGDGADGDGDGDLAAGVKAGMVGEGGQGVAVEDGGTEAVEEGWLEDAPVPRALRTLLKQLDDVRSEVNRRSGEATTRLEQAAPPPLLEPVKQTVEKVCGCRAVLRRTECVCVLGGGGRVVNQNGLCTFAVN